jgi:hypothetical protein
MKPFTKIAAIFFGLFALLHVARLYFGWEVLVNQHMVPVKASILVAVVAAVLAWGLWRESRLKKE